MQYTVCIFLLCVFNGRETECIIVKEFLLVNSIGSRCRSKTMVICGATLLLSADQGLIMKDWTEYKISEKLSGQDQHKMVDRIWCIGRHYGVFNAFESHTQMPGVYRDCLQ